MENRKYVVNRDDIYVGEVARTDKIYRSNGDIWTAPGTLDTASWRSYRSILFVPDENKLTNDLLYRSPSYPILNITDEETCLSLPEKSIVIKDSFNLAELLQYFGYGKDLTYEDIMKIRKTFFTGRFAKDNCELFGMEEFKAEDLKYYKNGVQITEPRELKRYIARERRSQKLGHRMFGSISETVLSRDYFHVLDDRGGPDFLGIVYGFDTKLDVFKPSREEGPVKKLSRY